MAQTVDVAYSEGGENDGPGLDGNVENISNAATDSEKIRARQNK